MKEWLKIIALFAAILTPLAAFITHIVVCLKSASWGFLIAGAILPPIGIIHGLGLWFGLF
jgi:hypothetical protein